MHIGLYVQQLWFLSEFKETWIFLADFQTMLWKSVHWEQSCSMWKEGQTDIDDKANIRSL